MWIIIHFFHVRFVRINCSFTAQKEACRETEQETGGGSEPAEPGWTAEDKPSGSKTGSVHIVTGLTAHIMGLQLTSWAYSSHHGLTADSATSL